MVSGTKKRIVWGVSITVGLVLWLSFVGSFIQYKEVTIWVCPVSGSSRTEIVRFGLFHQEKRTVTALEKWLKRKEPNFAPSWQRLSTDTYYVMGRSYGCSEAPEIYKLTPILDEVMEKLSDERTSKLVAVLRHGSHNEQQHMIEKITDEAFAEAAPGVM